VPYVELASRTNSNARTAAIILTAECPPLDDTRQWLARKSGREASSPEKVFLVEGSAGYLSIGQTDLNTWKVDSFVSMRSEY